jgi:hypothetical protein
VGLVPRVDRSFSRGPGRTSSLTHDSRCAAWLQGPSAPRSIILAAVENGDPRSQPEPKGDGLLSRCGRRSAGAHRRAAGAGRPVLDLPDVKQHAIEVYW